MKFKDYVKEKEPGYGDQGDDPIDSDIQESVRPTIEMTMPLFIRLLEWAKEECKTDVEIHQMAEKMAMVDGVADMDDYNSLLEDVKMWVRSAEMARHQLPDEVMMATLGAATTTGSHDIKSPVSRGKKLDRILHRSIRLLGKKAGAMI